MGIAQLRIVLVQRKKRGKIKLDKHTIKKEIMLAQSINLFAPARKESCAQFSTQLGAHFLRFPFTSHQPQQLTLFQIEVGNLSKESRTVSSLIPISQEQFQIFRFCNKLLLMKNTMSDDELHIPCSMDF